MVFKKTIYLELIQVLYMVTISQLIADEIDSVKIDDRHQKLLTDNCVSCHNDKKHKGGVRLDDLSLKISTVKDADRWQKILNVLNAGDMPPEDKPQLNPQIKADFLEHLATTLVRSRQKLSDSGSAVTMRRLNRREYINTIESLLGIHVDEDELPADGGTGSFDTVGASLFMSGDQIEQYLNVAQRALNDAYSTSQIKSPLSEHREVEELTNRVVSSTYKGYFVGGFEMANAWLSSDRSKPPKAFGLADEAEVNFRIQAFNGNSPNYIRYLDDPNTKTGSLLTVTNVNQVEVIALPPDKISGWDGRNRDPVPPGKYRIRIRLGALPSAASERRFLEIGSRSSTVDFTLMRTVQITGTLEHPQEIDFPVMISSVGSRSFAIREKRDPKLDGHRIGADKEAAIWVDWMGWEGPIDVNHSVFPEVSGQDESTTAQKALVGFATKAFRGLAPESDFTERLLKLYQQRRAAGDDHQKALIAPFAVILASPSFLYLAEPSTGKTPRLLNDRELAVRLSYMLWSAPPDEQLLDLARQGTLHNPAVLAREVDRLIDDPRSQAFVNGFVSQWLGLARLDFFQVNTKVHKGYDLSTKAAARQEVLATFAWILREKRSLSELLSSDTVVVNGLLAEFYGIPGVVGDSFRPVRVSSDSPRGGLLGMSAIMTMGGNGDHTSPVERGAWVLRKLLNDPPPPAPPNVPQISRLDSKIMTTRERVLAHQEQPQCSSCHRKIDPIGFGLENFDAVGRWRLQDTYEKAGIGSKTWTIDPSGALFRGESFKDFHQLRRLIAAKPEPFTRGMIKALIEYGLGRPYGFTDEDMTTQMVDASSKEGYRLRAIIHLLVAHPQFRRK